MKICREEVVKDIPSCGSFIEMMDMVFLPAFNVTVNELNYISDKMSDEEMNTLCSAITMKGTASFSTRREALKIRNKYLKQKEEEV